ncbi:hypothetical protein [Streptomyces litchfieldiae]|uniref:Uncharacterized protein n=1 Tax=Streptomyces litchfieldiae TaxID=3075543 RepID=A0ABU2N1H8_9ACTN|nr:hypothetical protein [Streptomyces sp. DSM 44938]MDT0347763.1 hypothetical protein [Streptomyces sp. DSM 44938]
MDTAIDEVRRLACEGKTFSEVIAALRELDSFTLTAFNLLHVLRESLGVPLHDTLDMLRFYDQDFRPTAPTEEIDQAGDRHLAGHWA